MDNLDQTQFILLLASVAGVAFIIGRATAGGASSEAREERRMNQQMEAERLIASLTPAVQQEVDEKLKAGKLIEAIKIIRENTGAGLRDAKIAADLRRAAIR